MKPDAMMHTCDPVDDRGSNACHATVESSAAPARRPSRRDFLLGVAAIGAGTLVPACAHATQMSRPAGKPRRIDVHNHLTPPGYAAEVASKARVSPQTAGWTVAKAIDDMDKGGVDLAITSVTTPGLWFGNNDAARRLAQSCNEYAAKLVADYPRRFGMFGAVSLPDVDGSLKEIEYCLDVLKADGISLFTSYGDKWLGDPAFNPVFEELNRRKAVVYTHPTTANCCINLVPGIGDTTVEYANDTTHAIARFIFSGSGARYPDLRMIFSHAGGTMPFLLGRFINLAKTPQYAAAMPGGFLPEARRFYYDTAQAANPATMAALRDVVTVPRILFGTDFPFLTAEEQVKGLKDSGIFSNDELLKIDRENTLELLPKYGS